MVNNKLTGTSTSSNSPSTSKKKKYLVCGCEESCLKDENITNILVLLERLMTIYKKNGIIPMDDICFYQTRFVQALAYTTSLEAGYFKGDKFVLDEGDPIGSYEVIEGRDEYHGDDLFDDLNVDLHELFYVRRPHIGEYFNSRILAELPLYSKCLEVITVCGYGNGHPMNFSVHYPYVKTYHINEIKYRERSVPSLDPDQKVSIWFGEGVCESLSQSDIEHVKRYLKQEVVISTDFKILSDDENRN